MRGLSEWGTTAGGLALALVLTACGGSPESPETEIQTFIAKVQTAAEERNARELRSLIAKDYIDIHGNDRKAIEGLIHLHILRNQSIHVFTRIQAIEFPEPERALVIVMAALASRPVARADELAGLNANLYRFNLELIRHGRDDWLVQHAAWETAQLADFW
ncbi:MAG TPA: hypothetical protein P5149_14960 [Candidatus Competibacteraceae bacterium]|nr:hypothetical protein [Candidatus Competibacteraceae bacterium]MCP5134530.1 hypothetical protein [Gammaproteobacteria bacterium]HPF58323.1 hypothetical protein [Candidatus Competibacteraceae bacterium]HRY19687.1 hypothetical protein [Candidatus Competibacteraceae bacterium]